MAAIDALGSSPTATGQSVGFSALSSEDFAKIIFTELGRQDPLQPNDTNALLEQLSSVRSIQADMDLSDRLQSLVNQNEFSSAATLIGKSVSGVTETNTRVTDRVRSISRTDDGPVLTLAGGQRLRLSNLDEIREVAAADDETTP